MAIVSDYIAFFKHRIQLPAKKLHRPFKMLLFIVLVLLPKSIAGQGIEQEFQFGGTIEVSPVPESENLSQTAVWAWLSLTSSYYRAALGNRVDLNPPISNPQALLVKRTARRPATNVVAIDFEAIVSFTSDSVNYDPAALVLPAFQNEGTILEYTSALRALGLPIFQEVNFVSMSTEPSIPVPAPTVPTSLPVRPPPTDAPLRITESPTPNPTTRPTRAPTRRPTTIPTRTPTMTPTAFPTLSPLSSPTKRPTPSPSMSPTASPTVRPTNELEMKYATNNLILKFTPEAMPLNSPIMERWKALTTNFLCNYIRGLNDVALVLPDDESPCLDIESVVQEHSPSLRNDEIEVSKEASTPTGDGLRRRNYGRKLEEAETPLATLGPLNVEFVTKINLPQLYDAIALVDGAFDTPNKRIAYRNWLLEGYLSGKKDGDIPSDYASFFQYLVQVESKDDDTTGNNDDLAPTTFPTVLPTGLTDGTSEDMDNNGEGIASANSSNFLLDINLELQWIALIGGVIMLMILAGGLWCCVKCRKGRKAFKSQPDDGAYNGFEDELPLSPTVQPQTLDFTAAEIVVGHVGEDDLSTIGNPVVFGHGEADDRTAANSILQTDTYNQLLGRMPGSRADTVGNHSPSKDKVPNTVSL